MEKIKKEKEFKYIYNKNKLHTNYLIIFFAKNNNNIKKFGFVTSKKVGNAVKRNRIRRILKEIIRLNEDLFKNYSFVFVAKSILKNIENINYKILEQDLLKGIKKIK